MVKVEANYDQQDDRIKCALSFDDEKDPDLTLKELGASVVCIAKFVALVAHNGNVTPAEYLRGLINDMEEGDDPFPEGLIVRDDEEELKGGE